MSLWLGYPDSHPMSRFHLPLFHCLNGLVISALDLFQDPLGPHADKHRRLAARVSMRLEAREHKSDLVAEVLGIVEALQRHSLTSDLGGERASSSSCSSRSPLLSSAALTLSPPTCAQTSPPSTTARSRPAPSSAARSRSRSRPIRSSPLRAPSASAPRQQLRRRRQRPRRRRRPGRAATRRASSPACGTRSRASTAPCTLRRTAGSGTRRSGRSRAGESPGTPASTFLLRVRGGGRVLVAGAYLARAVT